jgi:D-alanine-D-alanine ligase
VSAARRVRVAVVMGGPSSERGISLRSGEAVLRALDRKKYAILPVDIRPDGTWSLPAPASAEEPAASPAPGAGSAPGGLALDRVQTVLARAAEERSVDLVFVALHGKFGEDGTLQGLLESAGLPYTGSGVLASALAMDKARAKAMVASAGLRVPRGACVDRERWRTDRAGSLADLAGEPGFPAFVKPPGGGSSIGAGPADDARQLELRVDEVFSLGETAALVEERLVGREVTCAVLGNRGRPVRTLPPVEIVPKGRPFFDYTAKYDPAACEEVCPARLTAGERARVEDAAVAAHRALGCDGMSRSDFILVDGEPVYLETNTIPGLTENSLCPRAARAAGIPFKRLLDLLVDMALERGAPAPDLGAEGSDGEPAWRRTA